MTVIIEIVWKKDIEQGMNKILDSEIRKKKDELIDKLQESVSYLKTEDFPTFSESDIEDLSDAMKSLEQIKSRLTVTPMIIKAAISILASSISLFLYLLYPDSYLTNNEGVRLTLAHAGAFFLAVALWYMFKTFFALYQSKVWQRHVFTERHSRKIQSTG